MHVRSVRGKAVAAQICMHFIVLHESAITAVPLNGEWEIEVLNEHAHNLDVLVEANARD
jgi:hypothetical protein